MKRFDLFRHVAGASGRWFVRGTVMVAVAAAVMLMCAPRSSSGEATTAPANELTVKGTCTFNGRNSTWSVKLTPKGDNTYDADYSATWGNRALKYKGSIKTDWKGDISGDGASDKTGTFKFQGTFGDDGVAKCSYKEVGGGRAGTLTVTAPAAK